MPYDQINFVSRDTNLAQQYDRLVYTARNITERLEQLLEITVALHFDTHNGYWPIPSYGEIGFGYISKTVIGEWLVGENSDIPLDERGAPPVWLQDKTSIGRHNFQVSSNNQDNFGNSYVHALSLGPLFTMDTFRHPEDDHHLHRRGTFQTLLDGRYTRLRGTLFIPYGERLTGYTLFWYELDGKYSEEYWIMTNTTRPIQIDIDLTGVNDFQIIVRRIAQPLLWDFDTPEIYFGDFRFYS
jgi:hypothetical protein